MSSRGYSSCATRRRRLEQREAGVVGHERSRSTPGRWAPRSAATDAMHASVGRSAAEACRFRWRGRSPVASSGRSRSSRGRDQQPARASRCAARRARAGRASRRPSRPTAGRRPAAPRRSVTRSRREPPARRRPVHAAAAQPEQQPAGVDQARRGRSTGRGRHARDTARTARSSPASATSTTIAMRTGVRMSWRA